MSESPLEPLDPDLAALFAKEREQGELPAPDPDLVDRAIERAEERAQSLGSSSAPRPPSGQVPSAPSGAAYGMKALALSGLVGALVGGAVTYTWVAPSPSPTPAPSASSATAPPSASVPPSPDVSPSVTAAASVPTSDTSKTALPASANARPSASAAPSSLTATGDLVRERELVDAARAALTKGHPDETLRLLREHETRFASGQLAEEREALFVVAFARSGKKDAARGRLAGFRKAHPTSPMLSTLEREVGDLDASP